MSKPASGSLYPRERRWPRSQGASTSRFRDIRFIHLFAESLINISSLWQRPTGLIRRHDLAWVAEKERERKRERERERERGEMKRKARGQREKREKREKETEEASIRAYGFPRALPSVFPINRLLSSGSATHPGQGSTSGELTFINMMIVKAGITIRWDEKESLFTGRFLRRRDASRESLIARQKRRNWWRRSALGWKFYGSRQAQSKGNN